MSSKAAAEKEFVEVVAEQVACGVDVAVDRWMAEFDSVLQDPHLTTLGRLQAMSAIVARYRVLRNHREATRPQQARSAGWGIC